MFDFSDLEKVETFETFLWNLGRKKDPDGKREFSPEEIALSLAAFLVAVEMDLFEAGVLLREVGVTPEFLAFFTGFFKEFRELKEPLDKELQKMRETLVV